MEGSTKSKTSGSTDSKCNSKTIWFGVVTSVAILGALAFVLTYFLTKHYQPKSAFTLTASLPIISPKNVNSPVLLRQSASSYKPMSADYDETVARAQQGGFSVYHEGFVPVKTASVYLCMLRYTGADSVLSGLTSVNSTESEATYNVYIDNSVCDPDTEARESLKWTVRVSIGLLYLGRVEVWRDAGNIYRWSVDIYHGVNADYPAGKFDMSFHVQGMYSGWVTTDMGLSGAGTHQMKGVYTALDVGSHLDSVDYQYQFVADVQSSGDIMSTGSGAAKIWRTYLGQGARVLGQHGDSYYQMTWNGSLAYVRRSDNDTSVSVTDLCYSRDNTVTNVRIFNLFDATTNSRSQFAPSIAARNEFGQSVSITQNDAQGAPSREFDATSVDGFEKQIHVKMHSGQMTVTKSLTLSGSGIPDGTIFLLTPRDGNPRTVYFSGRSGTTLESTGFYWGVSRKADGWKFVALLQSPQPTIQFLVTPEAITIFNGDVLGLSWISAKLIQASYLDDSLIFSFERVMAASDKSVKLYCLSDCPVAAMTQAYVEDGACNSEFLPDPLDLQSVVEYTLYRGMLYLNGVAVDRQGVYSNPACGFGEETTSGKMVDLATFVSAASIEELRSSSLYYKWVASYTKLTSLVTYLDGSISEVETQRDFLYTHSASNDVDSSYDFDNAFMVLYLWGWDTFGNMFNRDTKPDGDNVSELYWAVPVAKTATGEDLYGNTYKIVPVTGSQKLQEVAPESCSSIVPEDPVIQKPLISDLVLPSNIETDQPTETVTYYNEGVCVSVNCANL